MKRTVKTTTLAGLGLAAVVAVGSAIYASDQQPPITGDFRNANAAEIRDAQGQVLLRGTFAPVDSDEDDEVERLAKLAPATPGSSATGEAEVEHRKSEPNEQEVEFQVSGVPARSAVTLVLDGKPVITVTADDKGKAEAEINVNVTSPRR
jgi:hypothetical protein